MHRSKIFAIICSGIITLASCSKKDDPKPKETVLYETDFSSNDGNWRTGSFLSGTVSASIENGYYTMRNNSTQYYYFATSRIFSGITSTTAIETSMKVTGIGAGVTNPSAALIWNFNTTDESDFTFGFSGYGQFTIQGLPDGNNNVVYKDWALHSAVRKNDFNTLRIELKNNMLYFFINGTEVYSMKPVNGNTLDQVGFEVPRQRALQVDYIKAVRID